MSSFETTSQLSKLRECIIDLSNPIAKRTHAAFLLRTIGTTVAAEIIGEALKNRKDSSLMRHELAYIIGQMCHYESCPLLAQILEDESEDVLVRHESAESLGAIGNDAYTGLLRKFSEHPVCEIAETCQIAVDLMVWRSTDRIASKSDYLSVDPAPPLTHVESMENLRKDLLDQSIPLFKRYRIMFTLRNLNTDEAALVLVQGFQDPSALFRHETAYVLGQMQREISIDGLEAVLSNKNEHRMVRHEAAEALGAIGGDRCSALLALFRTDGEQVVEESCQVALDTIDYWNTSDFE
jgi:deoxyhypusine monooxygenase